MNQIPADIVINAMLVAMVAHANQPNDNIYHVGSSSRNPVRYSNLQDYCLRYFTAKPWINKVDGKPVKVGKVTILTNMAGFQRYMFIRYLLLLKVCIYVYFQFLCSKSYMYNLSSHMVNKKCASSFSWKLRVTVWRIKLIYIHHKKEGLQFLHF